MGIQWRNEMAIDDGLIDRDHHLLIAVINEFCTPGPAGQELVRMREVLNRLDDYTRAHFSREESLQVIVRYPYAAAHHSQHKNLIRTLGDIRARVDAAADKSENEIHALRSQIDGLLHDWLVDHIIRSDLRLKPYASAWRNHAITMQPLG